VDLMKLAGLKPYGVLCELTNPDGTMARLPEIITFARKQNMPVATVDDLVQYRTAKERRFFITTSPPTASLQDERF
jgi:3,4-dihydroxy 2-butanone 4-phosphate synthase